MRMRSALGVGVLTCFLSLAVTAPAIAAPRLRLYRGQTSQGERITFTAAKTDTGRYVSDMDSGVTLTCDDGSTDGFGFVIAFGRASAPIMDKAFSFDEIFGNVAYHLAGNLGWLGGEGTMTVVEANLAEDEQPQLCTTGDLTWTVEFVRTL
jgi:hypothetical protein